MVEEKAIEEKIKHETMPAGMIAILVLLGIGAGSLISSLQTPIIQLGPKVVGGFWGILYILITIVIFGILFYGIIKKYKWARKLGIGWFIYVIASTSIDMMFFLLDKTMYDSYFSTLFPGGIISTQTLQYIILGLLAVTTLFVWIFGLIIIFYLKKKTDYFTE